MKAVCALLFLLLLGEPPLLLQATTPLFPLLQAETFFKEEEYSEALKGYRQWLASRLILPSDQQGRVERHRILTLIYSGQVAEAERILNESSEINREESLILRALCLFIQNEYQQVVHCLEQDTEIFNLEKEALLFFSVFFNNDTDRIEENLPLFSQFNSKVFLELLQALIHIRKEDSFVARDWLNRAQESLDDAPRFLHLVWGDLHGRLLTLEGDYEGAWPVQAGATQKIRLAIQALQQQNLPRVSALQWLDRAESVREAVSDWDWIQVLQIRWSLFQKLETKEEIARIIEPFLSDPEKKTAVLWWKAEQEDAPLLFLEKLLSSTHPSDPFYGDLLFRVAELRRNPDRLVEALTVRTEKIPTYLERWIQGIQDDEPLREKTVTVLQDLWDSWDLALQKKTSLFLCLLQKPCDRSSAPYQLLETIKTFESILGRASLFFREENWSEAESLFLQATERYPRHAATTRALLWAAECADRQGKEASRQYRKTIWSSYPGAPEAPQAYFSTYPLIDYGLGKREAIKHLEKLPVLFPDSPEAFVAHYLLGLNASVDRKKGRGKVVQPRNLLKAIHFFQQGEEVFARLQEQNLLSEEEAERYGKLKDQIVLERAKANQAVAVGSSGAKKQIYSQYAEEIFTSLLSNTSPPIQDEAAFSLATLHLQKEEEQKAEKLFSSLLARHPGTKDLFRMKIFRLKAAYALEHHRFSDSLSYLEQAEEAAPPNAMTVDEKLQNWIDRSTCHRLLGQTEPAMQWLSRVINEDFISGLRLQAMFLRSSIYEEEGRYELAKKQLEATAEKGGPWGELAKQKLERYYVQR